MSPAAERLCANPECGKPFALVARKTVNGLLRGADRRQRYCSTDCRKDHANTSRRKCRHCRGALNTAVRFQRFCSNACRWSYLQARRRKQSVTEQVDVRGPIEPVSVLLPLGCAPKPHAQVEDPEAIPRFRFLTCERYERCLTFAASKNWNGFTCRKCPTWSNAPQK